MNSHSASKFCFEGRSFETTVLGLRCTCTEAEAEAETEAETASAPPLADLESSPLEVGDAAESVIDLELESLLLGFEKFVLLDLSSQTTESDSGAFLFIFLGDFGTS